MNLSGVDTVLVWSSLKRPRRLPAWLADGIALVIVLGCTSFTVYQLVRRALDTDNVVGLFSDSAMLAVQLICFLFGHFFYYHTDHLRALTARVYNVRPASVVFQYRLHATLWLVGSLIDFGLLLGLALDWVINRPETLDWVVLGYYVVLVYMWSIVITIVATFSFVCQLHVVQLNCWREELLQASPLHGAHRSASSVSMPQVAKGADARDVDDDDDLLQQQQQQQQQRQDYTGLHDESTQLLRPDGKSDNTAAYVNGRLVGARPAQIIVRMKEGYVHIVQDAQRSAHIFQVPLMLCTTLLTALTLLFLSLFFSQLNSDYTPVFEMILVVVFWLLVTMLMLIPALVSSATDRAVSAAIRWLSVDAGKFEQDTVLYTERSLALQYFGICEKSFVVMGIRLSLPLVFTLFWTLVSVVMSVFGISI